MVRTLALLCALVLSSAAVHAAGIGGVWKSSSGATITIPPTNDFDLIYKGADGHKMLMTGAWLPQQVGVQFTYIVAGSGAAIATVDPQNAHRITVKAPNGVITVWTRVSTLTRADLQPATGLRQ
jgi:hypothetical protein